MSNDLLAKLQETESYIRQRTSICPKIALILGSGLGGLAESSKDDVVIPYYELPHFMSSTVPGHAGQLIFGEHAGQHLMVMQGRFHYYEGYTLDEVTYPIRLMKQLGVEHLIVTSATGGMNPRYIPGDIVLLKDFINLMGVNCLRGVYHPEFGERFPDMSEVYDGQLRKLALTVAKENRIPAYEGVYVAVSGPSYDTPSEIRAFRKLGGDVVGMSVVPETMAARQMDMKVLAISYVSNLASGMSKKPLSHFEVIKTGKIASQKVGALINGLIEALAPH
jgi:purine-nucleoside phosphorylase